MGGQDLTARPVEPKIDPFAPHPVNEEAAQREIGQLVSGLAPSGVDEATGHSLDNLINAWADQWVAEVTAQHAWYVARIVPNQMLSEATTSQISALLAHDRSILAHTVVGVESALLRLVGLEREAGGPNAGRRRHRIRRRRDTPGPGPGGDRAGTAASDWDAPAGHNDPPGLKRDVAGDGNGRPAGQPGVGAGSASGAADRDQSTVEQRASLPGQSDPAAAPPDADPADLNILLGPAHRRRFALWGDRGYSDASLLGGRSRMIYVHLLALVLAACADIGAFSQIVDQVMSQQGALLVDVVVVGFTAVVLYLAHSCGTMLRERKAGARWIPGAAATLCALVWLALGAAAYYLRLHFAPQAASSFGGFSASGAPSSGSPNDKPYNAMLFLALYAGTGLVAGIGAYLSYNPLRDSYVVALRGYRKATEKVAATRFRAEAEAARLLSYQAEFDAAAKTLAEEVAKRRAFAGKLKQIARVMIAQHLQDPAATDAMFGDDWRPYP